MHLEEPREANGCSAVLIPLPIGVNDLAESLDVSSSRLRSLGAEGGRPVPGVVAQTHLDINVNQSSLHCHIATVS